MAVTVRHLRQHLTNSDVERLQESVLALINSSAELQRQIIVAAYSDDLDLRGMDNNAMFGEIDCARSNDRLDNHQGGGSEICEDPLKYNALLVFTLDPDSQYSIIDSKGRTPLGGWSACQSIASDHSDYVDYTSDYDDISLYQDLVFFLTTEVLENALNRLPYDVLISLMDHISKVGIIQVLVRGDIQPNSNSNTQSDNNKENDTMNSLKSTGKKVVDTQKEAAKITAVVTVGKAGNAIATNLLKKHLPFYARGYVDQPIVQLAVASLLNTIALHFLADNNKATAASAAMVQAAMLDAASLIDVTKLVDELMQQLPVASLDSLVKQREESEQG